MIITAGATATVLTADDPEQLLVCELFGRYLIVHAPFFVYGYICNVCFVNVETHDVHL